jgi:hypothetical protein
MRGRDLKAKIKLADGYFSTNGSVPPPRYPNTMEVPAVVDSSRNRTSRFKEIKKFLNTGSFNSMNPTANWIKIPTIIILKLTFLRFSLISQAIPANTTSPARLWASMDLPFFINEAEWL